jgi:hypothetical protein
VTFNNAVDSKTINISSERPDDQISEDRFENSFLNDMNKPKLKIRNGHLKSVSGAMKRKTRKGVLSQDHKRLVLDKSSHKTSDRLSIAPDDSKLLPMSTKSNSRNHRGYTSGFNKSQIKSLSPKKHSPEYYLVFKEYERFIERSDLPNTNTTQNNCMKFEK